MLEYVLVPLGGIMIFTIHIHYNQCKPKDNITTRTKTSIRYAKENVREKRERER